MAGIGAATGLVVAILAWAGLERLSSAATGRCAELVEQLAPYRFNLRSERCVVIAGPDPVDAGTAPAPATPHVLNRDEVFDSLADRFFEHTGDSDIEGVVTAHFLVDATGVVRRQRIEASSGHDVLDRILLEVAPLLRFAPAEHQAEPTGAWVAVIVGTRLDLTAVERLQKRIERRTGHGSHEITPVDDFSRAGFALYASDPPGGMLRYSQSSPLNALASNTICPT